MLSCFELLIIVHTTGVDSIFVERMSNLEHSGELMKMLIEISETITNTETSMSKLIESIPRYEKKLMQQYIKKRPKGRKPINVGPRVRKIKMNSKGEIDENDEKEDKNG